MKRQFSSLVARLLSLGSGSVGLVLVLFVVAIALIGPFMAPHSPTAFVGMALAHPSPRYRRAWP
jgi:peptide/nickel transport system permease protein